MCLYINTNIPSVDEHDIVVYKVLRKNNGVYKTCVTGTIVNVKEVQTPKSGEKLIKSINNKRFGYKYYVDERWIHSYIDYLAAKFMFDFVSGMYPEDVCCIWKCAIPKKSEYLINLPTGDCASDKLVYLCELDSYVLNNNE